jgi:hypothetical protein
MPVHTLFQLALFLTLWMVWNVTDARWWTVAALVVHFAARVVDGLLHSQSASV